MEKEVGALNRSLRVVQAAPASHFDRSAGCLREIHSERLTGHCFLHPRAKRGGSCPTTDPEITEKLLRCQFQLYPTNQPGSPIAVTTSQLSRAGMGSGANSDGEIPPGGTYSVLVSELLRATGVDGSFVGHIFANCDFPSAQGINFIADTQFNTQSQGYPAIVIK